ncbi:MAG: hypothetical protein PHI06_08570 [Desulfobulbaceae bacterium]|nr:hypothetical protein [Desulfobulbaceae bacterium]
MMAFFHAVAFLGLFLSSCTNLPKTMEASSQHIALPDSTSLELQNDVPPLAETAPLPPPPKASKAAERYSVVVNNVLAQEILFALARDAKVNIEIHPNISGTVTMNLIDQTLPEILDAIARQIDIRYELNGRNLAIMPDSPYLKSYQVDYPNVSRNSENSISTSTSVAAIGQSGGAAGGSNSSSSTITNTSNNHFWETLVENIKDLLRETDKIMPDNIDETAPLPQTTSSGMGGESGTPDSLDSEGSSAIAVKSQGQAPRVAGRVTYREAASVIANPETGAISVRANSRQHANVQAFLDKVMVSARRQVLIEATIVEVSLSNQYQQGIDWSVLSNTSGLSYTQTSPVSAAMVALGTLNYFNPGNPSSGTDLSSTIKLLETFGKLHVLSSPKLSVLNNQTSLLKVVDEAVYFTVDVTPGTAATVSSPAVAPTYESTVHTVPVGFLMYVTPQIGSDSEVTLNLRPTISRILGYVNDPNPVFAENKVINRIPQIQTREMESILRVRNGEIAVLGGLMQDSLSGTSHKVPGAGNIFGIGELFKDRDDTNSKSELVIFLRPIILDQERQYDVLKLFKNPATTAEWQQNNMSARSSP